jgi:hypothetical protein
MKPITVNISSVSLNSNPRLLAKLKSGETIELTEEGINVLDIDHIIVTRIVINPPVVAKILHLKNY